MGGRSGRLPVTGEDMGQLNGLRRRDRQTRSSEDSLRVRGRGVRTESAVPKRSRELARLSTLYDEEERPRRQGSSCRHEGIVAGVYDGDASLYELLLQGREEASGKVIS